MTALSAKTITQLLSVSTRDKPSDDHEKMQFYYHLDHLVAVVTSVGSAGEMILDISNGDYCNGLKDAAFRLFEKGTEILLNKLVPGVGKKIGEEGFNLGTEILDQGRNLKNSGLERVTDKIIEKKKEENSKRKEK